MAGPILPNKLFSDQDAQYLGQIGILGEITINGSRRIPSLVFHDSITESEALNIFLSATSAESESTNYWIEVPDDLHSWATYHYIGFNYAKSRSLWERWSNMDAGARQFGSFIDWAFLGLRNSGHDVAGTDQDWNLALQNLGIEQDLRRSIMNPQYEQLRLMKSLVDWLIEIMEVRWRGLEAGQKRSLLRSRSFVPMTSTASGITQDSVTSGRTT